MTQDTKGFVIPPATLPASSTPQEPTESKTSWPVDIATATQRSESDASGQTSAIVGGCLLIWIIAALFFRRKWGLYFREKRVSENSAEASGWAFFGALTVFGVGVAAAFFDKFSTLFYLGPIIAVAIILFALAFFMARK